jgi:hypothetical protein
VAKVSISEAARLAGVSRQHLYKRFITPGALTVEKDGEKPPVIDTSELLRVFGELKGEGLRGAPASEALRHAEIEALRRQVVDKDAQLCDARGREERLWQHVNQIGGVLRLLENKASPEHDQAERMRKELARVKRVGQQQLDNLQAELEAERSKGFWARLFD